MSVDISFPAESGALFFIDLSDQYLTTNDDNDSLDASSLAIDPLRTLISIIAIPLFSLIGILYNFAACLIKIPIFFLSSNYHTHSFLEGIREHVRAIFIDILSLTPSTYCLWLATNALMPSLAKKISGQIRQEILPSTAKNIKHKKSFKFLDKKI